MNNIYKKIEDLREPTLIGRNHEWEKLVEYLDKSFEGSPAFVVLRGEEGSGKTRITKELNDHREKKFPKSLHICVTPEENDDRKPFWRIAHTVYQFHKTCGYLEKTFHVGTPSKSIGYDFVDFAMSNYSEEDVENIFFDVESDLSLVYSSVSGYLRSHSRAHKIILTIENCHNLDRNSGDFFLHFLNQLEEKDNIMVLFCYHGDDSSGENGMQRILPSMFRLGKIREVKLQPILARDIPRFISSMIGEISITDELATTLYKVTKGNPYRLQAFVQDSVKKNLVSPSKKGWVLKQDKNFMYQIPKEVEDLLIQNINKLGKYQKDILQWLAVAKRDLTLNTLSSATGLAEGQMPYVLDELLRERYLFERDALYGVTSQEIINKVLEGIEDKDILKRHLQLAKILEKQKTNENLSIIADHFLNGQDNKKAFTYCQETADYYYNEGFFEQALVYYQKALLVAQAIKKSLLPQILIAMGFTCYRLGNYKDATAHFNEANGEANKDEKDEVAKGKGLCSYAQHNYKQAYDILRTLQKKTSKIDEEIILVLVSTDINKSRFLKAQSYLKELEGITTTSKVLKPFRLRNEAFLHFYLAEWGKVQEPLEQAVCLFKEYKQIKELLETYMVQIEYDFYTKSTLVASELLNSIHEDVQELNDKFLFFRYLYLKGMLAAEQNMWEDAQDAFQNLQTLGKEQNDERFYGYGLLGIAFCKLHKDRDVSDVFKHCAKILDFANNSGDIYLSSEAYSLMAKAYLRENNLAMAQQYIDYSKKGWKNIGVRWKNYRTNLHAARLFSYLKDPKKSLMVLEKVIQTCQLENDQYLLADAFFEKGFLYKRYQKPEKSAEYLAKSLEMYKEQHRIWQYQETKKIIG